MFAFVFDESLFAFAYETPPNAFALLFDRYTTRVYMRKSAFVLSGSTGTRLTSGRLRYPHNVLRCFFYLNQPDLWLYRNLYQTYRRLVHLQLSVTENSYRLRILRKELSIL